VEKFVVDVGPEFFEDERSAIDRDVCNPKLVGLGKGALLAGVVEARDARGRACPEYLGCVEGFVAAIGSGDCDT
jgi:hypothetical protein